MSREHALSIFTAAVEAADPGAAVRWYFPAEKYPAGRTFVVGGGKAGGAMAAAFEAMMPGVSGVVNVPEGTAAATSSIYLHPSRPAGSNHPTAAGVEGVRRQLALIDGLSPGDLVVCLLSGGGSALMPAPVEGVSLEDKQAVTRLLHAAGATINEMNCVRKHLSDVKGGRLAERALARGARVLSLIVSDVVGDPLDVIASGPTAPDPTTFADAVGVLKRFGVWDQTPASIRSHLGRGERGEIPETPKSLPDGVSNVVLCSNTGSLSAAEIAAKRSGYRVLNLGSFVEGETRHVAETLCGVVRSIKRDGLPLSPPCCVLLGGETTVTLGGGHGKGGRNQEFVLAMLHRLGVAGMEGVTVFSAGTDGEDGPTDAAGAVGDAETLRAAGAVGLDAGGYLERHDAYHFFDAVGGLVRTGLTGTNVMDVRMVLVR